jgi:hypothetical protein
MPFEQDVVDDGQRAMARVERLGQVGLEPVAVAVDDALLRRGRRASRGVLGRPGVDLDPVEEGQQLLQRVVVVGAAVVDQVEADLLGPLVNP